LVVLDLGCYTRHYLQRYDARTVARGGVPGRAAWREMVQVRVQESAGGPAVICRPGRGKPCGRSGCRPAAGCPKRKMVWSSILCTVHGAWFSAWRCTKNPRGGPAGQDGSNWKRGKCDYHRTRGCTVEGVGGESGSKTTFVVQAGRSGSFEPA